MKHLNFFYFIILHVSLCPYSYIPPTLLFSFLLPFYPFYFLVTAFFSVLLSFRMVFFTPSSFSVLTPAAQCLLPSHL